jgi:hypothetical protein
VELSSGVKLSLGKSKAKPAPYREKNWVLGARLWLTFYISWQISLQAAIAPKINPPKSSPKI